LLLSYFPLSLFQSFDFFLYLINYFGIMDYFIFAFSYWNNIKYFSTKFWGKVFMRLFLLFPFIDYLGNVFVTRWFFNLDCRNSVASFSISFFTLTPINLTTKSLFSKTFSGFITCFTECKSILSLFVESIFEPNFNFLGSIFLLNFIKSLKI